MARWDGFRTFERALGDRMRLEVCADYGGDDDDPTPLAIIRQWSAIRRTYEMVELTEDELRWLVEEVAPTVLLRMGARP